MNKPLIQLKELTKQYVNDDVVTPVLHGVTFDIMQGEFVSIMGPSGSGKSTLMHILGFLDRFTTGEYLFEGESVRDLEDDKLAWMRREKVGFVFQQFNLLQRSTVLDNVLLPLIYAEVPNGERIKRAMKVIHQVGLEHRTDYLSNKLSGGERQRVAIARAFANEPSIVFADEPTGNLDTKTGLMILGLLQDLNEQGHTIVMVTHEQEAAEFGKRIIRVRDGRIESDKSDHKQRNGNFTK